MEEYAIKYYIDGYQRTKFEKKIYIIDGEMF